MVCLSFEVKESILIFFIIIFMYDKGFHFTKLKVLKVPKAD